MRAFHILILVAAACGPSTPARSAEERKTAAERDTGFAAVQARGAEVMGVDQYTSTHLFTPTATGGLIALQRDTADTAGVARIRAHMHDISKAFSAGDFSLPGTVHAQEVPGSDVMRERRAVITYAVEELPRGAQVRIVTGDTVARDAVHAFLAFQRMDHKSGMHHPKGH